MKRIFLSLLLLFTFNFGFTQNAIDTVDTQFISDVQKFIDKGLFELKDTKKYQQWKVNDKAWNAFSTKQKKGVIYTLEKYAKLSDKTFKSLKLMYSNEVVASNKKGNLLIYE